MAFATAVTASVAQAAPQSESEVELTASSPPTCTFGTPTVTGSPSGAQLKSGATPFASSVTITSVDPDTAMLGPATITLQFPAMCNYANHNLSLRPQNGHLTLASVPASTGSFETAIDYLASALWLAARFSPLTLNAHGGW